MAVRKKKTALKKVDLIYAFVGEYVQLMGSFSFQNADSTMANIEGFLMDINDEFIFLGPTPDELGMAVKRESVFSVQITEPRNEAQEMLMRLPTPEKEYGN